MYDVVVIGAGVTGCAVARELSRKKYRIAVLERESDVCEGTSKANSGIVHAGYDAKTGTLKQKLNVLGNQKMEQLSRDLDFPFKRNGSMVLLFDEEKRPDLEALLKRGQENGVKDLRILEREECLKLEPHLSDQVVAALYAPTGGIVCPFGLTIALAENAAQNGVEFHLNTEVQQISKLSEGYQIETNGQTFETKIVINAAGVYADKFHNMVSEKKFTIVPRRGEYCLMDKNVGDYVSSTLFQLPGAYGKGILVTPTVHGNLLVGPTALDIDDKEGNNTTSEGLGEVLEKAANSIKSVPFRKIITSFAGLRAHEEGGDFIIGEVQDAPGFIDVAGIASPGLSAAPAIGEYVAEIVARIAPADEKDEFISTRKGIPSMALADDKQKHELIQQNPAYANVICRCEMVTEGEILDAIHRPLGATTLDGVKHRTRAGMGRCQSGFCAPKTVEILARELKVDMAGITKHGDASKFLTGINKE